MVDKKHSGGTKNDGVSKTDEPQASRPRRPWQTPQIESGQLFESNSLSCGKDSPMNEQCAANPSSS